MANATGKFFSRLQWKLILIFMLLIVSVVLIAGTFLLTSVSTFYLEKFKTQMNQEFDGDITKKLNIALKAEDSQTQLKDVMDAFSTSRLGINENRDYYILSGESGKYIFSSSQVVENPDLSENIITAMTGSIGNKVSIGFPYMDYAYPLKLNDKVEYIIYIKDNKSDVTGVMSELFSVIVQAVLYSTIIAFIIGIFLSRTITVPISHLTRKASKIAEGKFDSVIEVKSNDEIGVLTTTFNTMTNRLKKTLDDISGERDKISVILKNLADGVIAFDNKQESLHINPAAEKMLGISSRKKYKFDELFSKYEVKITFEEAISKDNDIQREHILKVGDYVINSHFAPYRTEHKKADGVVVALQDITKQQKLDETRRAFVANVSHELRTPLTNIKSYSETLLEADIDSEETKKEFLTVIDSEADRMTRLVKDLLTLSSFDHNKQEMVFEKFDLGQLAEKSVNAMMIDAKNHQQTLTYIPSGTSTFVVADKDRINQVIVNILSNAIKYTPKGGNITVVSGQQEQHCYIKVSDTGLGIPEKDLPFIFDRFYRVDKARSREMGGTGLGLAIAKEIIEAHSGTISIDSIYQSGTTVTIKLPLLQNKGVDKNEQTV